MTVEPLNFDSLVTAYRARLKSYAMNFTHDEEDANDLVQDTLIKAFSYFSNFKPGTNFRGWLFTIMKNTFINNYRRNSRSKALIVTEEDISSSNLAFSATRNNGELKFINEDISKALKTLPSHLFEPFMRHFEGFKYQEIAEELNMPVGTVKTRIHHARLHLKKYLKVYEDFKGKIK